MVRKKNIHVNAIEEAAGIIRRGGIVAFPTETVYGLGGDAFNPRAVAGIFAAKQRPRFDPLIVHIHALTQLDSIAAEIPPAAWQLIKNFWPGPLTIIVPKKDSVPDIVTSGLPAVGIRMPDNAIALELIKSADVPLAAPSANKFAHISPTCAAHVTEQFGEEIDMVLDGGPCTVGVESTIIGFTTSQPVLLRPGGIALEDIDKVIGKVDIPAHDALTSACSGRQLRHYAPVTPLIIDAGSVTLPGVRKGLLSFVRPSSSIAQEYAAIEVLSEKGDLAEAACNLFAAMRRLDSKGLDVIVATAVPDHGLGRAINDRLTRASQSRKPKGK